MPSPKHRPWRLPPAARATLASIARVVCPPHTDELDVESIGPDHELIDEMEASVRALSEVVRTALLAGILTYDAGAWVRHGKPARRLDMGQSRDYFAAWLRIPGPTHELAMRLKQFVCMAYYELPVVQAALDYQPATWIARVKAEREERFAEAIRAHEDSVTAPDPLPRRSGPALVPGASLTRRLARRLARRPAARAPAKESS